MRSRTTGVCPFEAAKYSAERSSWHTARVGDGQLLNVASSRVDAFVLRRAQRYRVLLILICPVTEEILNLDSVADQAGFE